MLKSAIKTLEITGALPLPPKAPGFSRQPIGSRIVWRTEFIDLSVARYGGGTGANAPLVFNVDCNIVACLWADTADRYVLVRFDNDGDNVPFCRKVGIEAQAAARFQTLTITYPAQGAGAQLALSWTLDSSGGLELA